MTATSDGRSAISSEGSAGERAPHSVLVLVRHGETLGNRERRFQRYDVPLSEVGRAQAARLAERIAAEPPLDALYSSDLARTRETAEIIGRRVGLEPVLTAALRELDVGDWKGETYKDVESLYPGGLQGWLGDGGAEPLPGVGGESVSDVTRRALAFVDEAIARHPGERIALVSHGLTLAIVLAHIHGWDCTESLRERRTMVTNTAVSMVEVDVDGARRCTLLGCTAHLEGGTVEALTWPP